MNFLHLFQKLFSHRKKIIGATDLQRAFAHAEFVFYYQPEWDLKTGKIQGVEALIRWNSSEGLVMPGDFLPTMEEAGLMNTLTPYLLDHTLNDLKELHAAGFDDLFLSVNLSVTQLRDAKLPGLIHKSLGKYGILPDYFECEITETHSFGGDGSELETLKILQKGGIKVSIDDFGSGNASFNYIKNLNTYKLKIDREFIRDLFEKESNQTITRTMIELGHSLGFTVLAEGVETQAQEKWLRDNDCDFAQGYLMSRPLPLPLLISFLRANVKPNKPAKTNEETSA